jgi:hypothetical protein
VKELDNLPNSLIALDRNGRKLSEVDLSWGYPNCQPDLCAYRRTKTGNWVIVRDPIASQQSAIISPSREQRAKRLVFSDAAVRQIISGRQFSLGSIAYWTKCNGGLIGVEVPVQLTRPVSIEGELPYTEFRNGTGHAYFEGRAYYRVENVREIDVFIDLNRKLVVSIDPTVGSEFGSDPVLKEWHVIGKLHPAGGTDTANCPSTGD